MISAEQYKLLSIEAKGNILWKDGAFLEEVIDYGKYRVWIYELNKFFVGVYYSVKQNRIEKIEVLKDRKDDLIKSISPN